MVRVQNLDLKLIMTGWISTLSVLFLFSETMETYEDLSSEPMLTHSVELSSLEQQTSLELSSYTQTVPLESTSPIETLEATSSIRFHPSTSGEDGLTQETRMEVEPILNTPPQYPVLEVTDFDSEPVADTEHVHPVDVVGAEAGEVISVPDGASSLVQLHY